MNSGPKTPLSLMIAIFTLALTLDMTLIAATSRRPKLESARQGCEYEGALYMPGSKFKPDPCTSCRCKKRGGVVNCIAKDCTPDPNCRKYVVFGSKKCCPSCLEMGCRHS
ncbi:kielin/chordin-like protein, partial [Plakobranchus ocellatus]